MKNILVKFIVKLLYKVYLNNKDEHLFEKLYYDIWSKKLNHLGQSTRIYGEINIMVLQEK